MLRDAARNDAAEMRQIRLDVQSDAVPAHPPGHAHPDGRDLRLAPGRPVRHPDADAPLAPFAAYAEAAERADQPFLEPPDVAPHVTGAHLAVRLRQVQHQIHGALAWPMIGPLPA